MNSDHQIEENTDSEIFIPMLPDKKKRFGMMLATAIPGLVLFMSAISSSHETVLLSGIKFFSCLAAIIVVIVSVKEFIKPGSASFMGADTITVFTGFLIIALGANMYDAMKGFQPAHGYFLAGFIAIFKGVMVPEKKIKRGFTVSQNEITFKSSLFGKPTKLPIQGLSKIEYAENKIHFFYADKSQQSVKILGSSNGGQMVEALRRFLVF